MNRFPNLGWIFYRKAFDLPDINLFGKDEKQFTESERKALKKHQEDISSELLERPTLEPGSPWQDYLNSLQVSAANHTFTLVTTYPGLLIGAGYSHEAGLFGEFKLGFYFDHTTGLPVIPGSSIKGALRSAFPNSGEIRDENKAEFILSLLEQVNAEMDASDQNSSGESVSVKQIDKDQIDDLEYEIFEGKKRNKDKPTEWEVFQNIYQRDIFYDAFIIESHHTRPDGRRGHILGNDYITPHKHTGNPRKPELDPFSDPIPLQFLKVLPEVTFCFQFKLHDGIISAGQKRELFKKILLTLGVGAKTNVGYGQFRESSKTVDCQRAAK